MNRLPEMSTTEKRGGNRSGRIGAICLLCLLLGSLFPHAALGAEKVFTPSKKAAKEGDAVSYWTTPMDITDEKAVWKMLMAPVTVLDGDQKSQVYLRAKPNRRAKIVGEVTCRSQGVQVLGKDQKGWTKIRCYSSSFHGSKSKKWNKLVEGWVETKLLTVIKPDPSMGLVIDKLTQRMYIFQKGKLFTTLRISTGLPNEDQPYNETRSGEFLLVSKVGNFASGTMVCEMALRFNFGDLMHQVPYYQGKTYKSYDIYETKLGERASHGCIRVQRRLNADGVNMKWLYKRYKENIKLVIWEDWEGREKPAVAPDTKVYYSPVDPKHYHCCETCYRVTQTKNKKKELVKMKAIPFKSLKTKKYASLTACTWCNPPE